MTPETKRAENEAWMRGKQARDEYRENLKKAETPKPEPPQPYGVRHPNSIIVWLAHEFWPRIGKEEQPE
jgi:hypothetical protein